MKIISCHLQNFASYKELDFTFDSQGLALVQGPTGAGKSTLCDAIPWVLFGRTAKDGAVDEVRSWGTDGGTSGQINIRTDEGNLRIVRIRGKSANDLYFDMNTIPYAGKQRGKDLNDTQKLINQKLGMDFALYSSGAYFSEFSQTAQFFQTTAKNRRVICEQLVDLSLAKSLQTELSLSRKELNKIHAELTANIWSITGSLKHLRNSIYQDRANTFEADKVRTIEDLSTRIHTARSFTTNSNKLLKKIEQLNTLRKDLLKLGTCKECGAPTHNEKLVSIKQEINELQLNLLKNEQNIKTIADLENRLVKVSETENNFMQLHEQNLIDIRDAELQLDLQQSLMAEQEEKLADIDLLLELIDTLRSATIASTIQQLEDHTNQLLSNHFDAEIKVLFEVADADKLDVTILKDGNHAVFTQLSKGQRCLLKLCFAVSVMRQVANHHGVTFNCVMFDEALSGLDDSLKHKAFGLLQTLERDYSTILVIDHNSDFKTLFNKSYEVSLVDGWSQIEES